MAVVHHGLLAGTRPWGGCRRLGCSSQFAHIARGARWISRFPTPMQSSFPILSFTGRSHDIFISPDALSTEVSAWRLPEICVGGGGTCRGGAVNILMVGICCGTNTLRSTSSSTNRLYNGLVICVPVGCTRKIALGGTMLLPVAGSTSTRLSNGG